MKEAGGRKVFASVEILDLAKKTHGINEADHRVATVIILRKLLDDMHVFHFSPEFKDNMDALNKAKRG